MSRPTNVVVELDESTRSFEQLIRKFMRKCKDEGILKEYTEQFRYETKGQKERSKRQQGRRRHLREKRDKDRRSPPKNS